MGLKYKVELLIEIPPEISEDWDSICDEENGIIKYLGDFGNNILDYTYLSEAEYGILLGQKIDKGW